MASKLTNRTVLRACLKKIVDLRDKNEDGNAYLSVDGNIIPTDEAIAKLESMIGALNNKAVSRNPTAIQKENAKLIIKILEALEKNPNLIVTCSDVIKKVPDLEGFNTQRVTPMLQKLVDAGKITKFKDKGKNFYQLAK